VSDFDGFELTDEQEENVRRRVLSRLYLDRAQRIAGIYVGLAEKCEQMAHLWARRARWCVARANRWLQLAELSAVALAHELDQRARRLNGVHTKEAA